MSHLHTFPPLCVEHPLFPSFHSPFPLLSSVFSFFFSAKLSTFSVVGPVSDETHTSNLRAPIQAGFINEGCRRRGNGGSCSRFSGSSRKGHAALARLGRPSWCGFAMRLCTVDKQALSSASESGPGGHWQTRRACVRQQCRAFASEIGRRRPEELGWELPGQGRS